MTIIEKIKAEVERLQDIYADAAQMYPTDEERFSYAACAVEFGDAVYSFLSTLESEKPVPNDLEEYASRAGFDYVDDIVLLAEPNHRWNDHDVEQAYIAGFKAGAEWMAKQGVTFTAPVDHYERFYLDTYDQEDEALRKLGLKVMDWAIVQIRKK